MSSMNHTDKGGRRKETREEDRRTVTDRRRVERRKPRKAVTIRHDDPEGFMPKRIRRTQS